MWHKNLSSEYYPYIEQLTTFKIRSILFEIRRKNYNAMTDK